MIHQSGKGLLQAVNTQKSKDYFDDMDFFIYIFLNENLGAGNSKYLNSCRWVQKLNLLFIERTAGSFVLNFYEF